ncbi:nuclear transport factor 2 family protein [Chondromyces apiculatus]|uniref:SnoaL-like domain-containing protein n=1 Tax=Chondromyces apiculatus DSM 436 TaxID=1192034 RepID=A0A017ST23_9BACT|nr:nuclear transport factor 2 family protein [Chondromyces apiculatus]EYF00094.1 Hypothetical protein CAP_1378 [Chondromyces apiculatus DSM 436]
MTPDEKIALLRSVFAEFARTGTPQVLIDNITEDAVYKVSVGPGTPVSGDFVGREGITGYFRDLPTIIEHLGLNIYDYLANDNRVVVLGDQTLRTKKGGVVFFSEWAAVFTFRGDKICHFLSIENVGALSNVYGAPPASPPAHAPTSTQGPISIPGLISPPGPTSTRGPTSSRGPSSTRGPNSSPTPAAA